MNNYPINRCPHLAVGVYFNIHVNTITYNQRSKTDD